MSSEPKILPIWARADEQVDMDAIKRAKASLDLPICVPKTAKAGLYERVLAVGTKPPWVGGAYYLVAHNASQQELRDALSWVLGDQPDWEAVEPADTLSSIFGGKVRELSAEELAAEEKMIDYIQRRA